MRLHACQPALRELFLLTESVWSVVTSGSIQLLFAASLSRSEELPRTALDKDCDLIKALTFLEEGPDWWKYQCFFNESTNESLKFCCLARALYRNSLSLNTADTFLHTYIWVCWMCEYSFWGTLAVSLLPYIKHTIITDWYILFTWFRWVDWFGGDNMSGILQQVIAKTLLYFWLSMSSVLPVTADSECQDVSSHVRWR